MRTQESITFEQSQTKKTNTIDMPIKQLIAIIMLLCMSLFAFAQKENASRLWYGDDDVGIEIINRTGKNLAYTEEDPRINPIMTEQARKMDQALLKVGERTYMAYGWGLTSTMMVVGDDGLIIIDPPESMETAEQILAKFRTVTDLPVKAIIYTHNHFDHLAGVKVFTSEEEVAEGKVDIYAHETLVDGVINWASTVGPIEGHRTSYTGGVFLEKGPNGSVHDALGPNVNVGQVTFIAPTVIFKDSLNVEVAGIKMHLRHVPSETNDQIIAWFPDLKLINTAEVIQGENFPNLHSIRGTKYRDPVQWYKGVDILREYPAEFMVPTHGRPVAGYENIQELFTAYRDAIQFVHDQTIRYMNMGYTPDELAELVVLPQHLAEHPWLGEHYGTVKHTVRNIYNGYLGWFQADPWELDPLPYQEKAQRYVDLMGGREAVLEAARQAIEDEEYTWAAEILTNVIRIDNDDMEARMLKAEAYRQFAYTLSNMNWRNWTLTAVAELEGTLDASNGIEFTSKDVIQTFTTDKLLAMLTTRLDAEKSIDVNMTLGFRFEDSGEEYALEIRRGVMQLHSSIPANADLTITIDRSYLNQILVGEIDFTEDMLLAVEGGSPAAIVALMSAIDGNDVLIEGGTIADLKQFFSYLDPPSNPADINLIVR